MPIPRRKLILASLLLPITASAAPSVPIHVDVTGVTDVPSLIAAIKRSAGSLLPAKMPDKDFYNHLAKIFIQNARSAADLGYQVPDWILDRLPQRKVVFPVLGIAIFTLYGIQFAVPVSTIMAAVLASIGLMTLALGAALSSAVQYSSSI